MKYTIRKKRYKSRKKRHKTRKKRHKTRKNEKENFCCNTKYLINQEFLWKNPSKKTSKKNMSSVLHIYNKMPIIKKNIKSNTYEYDNQEILITNKLVRNKHNVIIGEGGVANVYQAYFKNKKIGIKKIKILTKRSNLSLFWEASFQLILYCLTKKKSHDKFARIPEPYFILRNPKNKNICFFGFELLHDSLYFFLDKEKDISLELFSEFILPCCKLLKMLQEKLDFIHGDLHIKNIMYYEENGKRKWYIIDFGKSSLFKTVKAKNQYFKSGLVGNLTYSILSRKHPDFRKQQFIQKWQDKGMRGNHSYDLRMLIHSIYRHFNNKMSNKLKSKLDNLLKDTLKITYKFRPKSEIYGDDHTLYPKEFIHDYDKNFIPENIIKLFS